MANLRKWVDVRLVTNEKKLDKLTSKATYVSSKIFNENLMAVHKIKESLTLNIPAYVGMCILDLSKMLMYDFHYGYIKGCMAIKPNYCLQTRTRFCMKLKRKMYTKTFIMTKTCSTIATIQKPHITRFASSKLVKPELLIFRNVVHPSIDDHLNHPMI